MIAFALTLLLAQVPAGPSGSGRQDYATYCATCHGADLRGTVDGPNIRGAGAADVDFMLQTGRMPAAVPWIEIGHRGAQLPQRTIDALVAYVTSVEPGGEPIPWVATGGNLQHGEALYRQNCEHCHGVYAQGAYIGGNEWAPSLHETSVTQVAEAIRIGPDQMPRFAPSELNDRDLVDVATYVTTLNAKAQTFTMPLASSGPVPEGLLGWLAVFALGTFAFAFGRAK